MERPVQLVIECTFSEVKIMSIIHLDRHMAVGDCLPNDGIDL